MITTLDMNEIDLVDGAKGSTAQALRDVAAAAAVVGTVAALGGAEPVAVGAFVVSAVASLGAAIIGD